MKGIWKKLSSWCSLPIFGLIVTANYLLGATYLLYDRIDQLNTMPLNEIGDFLAGIFGALAFFWLVIGYFMQNNELKLNRRSLEKQIEEFERSVKNQEEHFELIKEKENYEKDVKSFQSKPILSISKAYHSEVIDQSIEVYYDANPTYDSVSFSINNDGGEIFNISIKIYKEKLISNNFISSLRTFQEESIYIQEDKISTPFKLEISYNSRLGERSSEYYLFEAHMSEHNLPSFIQHGQGHQESQVHLTVTKIKGLEDGN